MFADQGDPRSLHDISCVVIGREMQGISKANLDLHHRLKRILGDHIAQGDESSFVVNMVAETKRDVEECVGWLKHMVEAMAEETKE